MDIGTISVRYARALLKYAIEQGEEDKVYADMNVLSEVYLNIPQLGNALENPALSVDDRKDLLCRATGGKPSETTRRFFELLARKRRTGFMQFVANSYVSLFLSQKNIVKGKLTVPVEISGELVGKIQKMVESETGSAVEMDIAVDSALGGGFVLEFGSYRIDASIGNQVRDIRNRLLRTAGNQV